MKRKKASLIDYLKGKDLVIFLLLLLAPMFFYKLGQNSLSSWDEAWYADIARNISLGKNPFVLSWNGKYFYDHPPVGFWLTSVSYLFFGVTNLSARFSQALFGLGSVVLTYLVAKELFGKIPAVFSAVALVSCPWFLLRARSGNLDVYLLFFFLLVFYSTIMINLNAKYKILLFISLSLLFLTKTMIPVVVIPALIVYLIVSKTYKEFSFSDLLWFLLIVVLPFLIWLSVYINLGENIYARYLKIGFPSEKVRIDIISNLLLTKDYIYFGVGKWFWFGILSLITGTIFYPKKFIMFFVFFLTFIIPFLFTNKGSISHLIPLHPIIVISFFGFWSLVGLRNKLFYLLYILLLLNALRILIGQYRYQWANIINVQKFISDEEILSKEASRYDYRVLYVDGDYIPAAVFYFNGKVEQIPTYELKDVFNKNKKIILISWQWRLDQAGINKNDYRIIKKDRDKILIEKI